jgi:DNA modification methylase
MTKDHPATFNKKILAAIRRLLTGLPSGSFVLDPFCGEGNVSKLGDQWTYFGIEIEEEWAQSARQRGVSAVTGDSTNRDIYDEGSIDAIVSSPTYGNRLADNYAPDMTDGKHGMRRTYRIYLERPLTEGNTGGMQWGEKYRRTHEDVLRNCYYWLKPGGPLVWNVKAHVRNGKVIDVPAWFERTLTGIGFVLMDKLYVPVKGDQNTATMRSLGVDLMDHEVVFLFRRV